MTGALLLIALCAVLASPVLANAPWVRWWHRPILFGFYLGGFSLVAIVDSWVPR